jgi:hypothetical protein
MAVRSRIADWRSWKSVSELDDDTEASYKWQSDRENAIVSLKAKKSLSLFLMDAGSTEKTNLSYSCMPLLIL